MHDDEHVQVWARRITNEFLECPGLRLTAAQAARFWGLDRPTIEMVFEQLVERAVLVRTSEGVFIRPAGEGRRT
jgi:Fic family protein